MKPGRLLIPPPLQEGAYVGLITPARTLDAADLAHVAQVLQADGLRLHPFYQAHLRSFQYSAPDDERAAFLSAQLRRHDIAAFWAGRGGYGTLPILDRVQWWHLAHPPRWVIGYSDITALLVHLWTHYCLVAIHGPVAREASPSFSLRQVTARAPLLQWQAKEYYRPGRVTGYLVGGNLSVLYSLLGSRTLPREWERIILFIEDVDEYLYHIDRMIWALRRAEILNHIAGLVVGAFTDIHDHEIPFGQSVAEIIANHTRHTAYPVAMNFPAGHIPDQQPFWHGALYEFTVTASGQAYLAPLC